jgi:hypothetical protein
MNRRLVTASFIFSGFHRLVIRCAAAITILIKTSTIPAYFQIFHNAPHQLALGKNNFSTFCFKVFFELTPSGL